MNQQTIGVSGFAAKARSRLTRGFALAQGEAQWILWTRASRDFGTARPEALRILRVFMGHATAKACAELWLSQDLTNPEAFTISDRWITQDELDEHVRSAEYPLLLTVIDLSVTPPGISFDELEHIGDLDRVQAVRAPQRTVRKDDRT